MIDPFKFTSVFLLAVILGACVSPKYVEKSTQESQIPYSFSHIRIQNQSMFDSINQADKYYSFQRLTKMSLSRKDTLTDWAHTFVQLDSVEKGIEVRYFLNDSLQDFYLLKGNWRYNFFKVKRRVKAKGIPPIFFFYNEKLSSIGYYKDSLTLHMSEVRAGMVVMISGGGYDNYSENYKVVE